MAGSIGANGIAERKYSQPPETGTLATITPPAWAPSTAYTRSPLLVRVNNGGNIYQCRTDGTSASSGGPTGTGADITDGTAHWTYIGAAYGNDTVAGSQILAMTVRGNESTASPAAPSDNDSGSYTVVESHAYASFSSSVAAVYRRSTASNTKTAFAGQANWGGTSVGSGTGDELDIGWIEIRGVQVGAPHAQSHVERANATANVVTSANITTTVPCLVVSYWFGNGNVITPGTSHTAVPLGGYTLIPGATCLMSLSNDGYVQQAVAWKIENTPGTFAAQWTTAASEGAQLVMVAYALAEIAAVGTASCVSTASAIAQAGVTSVGTAACAATASATSQAAAMASGTAACTSTASAAAVALAGAAGAATCTSTASATASSESVSSGTAAGISAASATAATLQAAIGTANGASAASAVSAATAAAVGTAECVSTASAVSGSPTTADGTAICTSTASATAAVIAAATGTAAAVSTASAVASSEGSTSSSGTATCIANASAMTAVIAASSGTATCTSSMFSASSAREARRSYTSGGSIIMATTLIAGDLEPDLLLQLTEASDLGNGGLQALDISDVITVQLRIRRPDGSSVVRTAAVESGPQGTVRYQWTADDTSQVGQHRAQVVLTWANGENQTVPSDGSAFIWNVNAAL